MALTSRCSNPFSSRLRSGFLPFLWRSTHPRFPTLTYATTSFHSRITTVDSAAILKRRFSIAAMAMPTSQSQTSDNTTNIPPDNRISAMIITKFLGSGKTTLLNHILTAEHGKKIAVIENEYGEVDIDGSLVAAKTTGAEDIVMLNNGCLCCTVRAILFE